MSKYMREKPTELKGETDNPIARVGIFNIPHQ